MTDELSSHRTDTPPRTIPVICGPTAAGKSAVAMRIAERANITIISADSRQIYRGFDVGTAKPTATDRERVPHQGIDVVDPTERYSAAQWAELADRAIDDALAEERIPVVVGGTGFYIRALFEPLWSEPPLDRQRRDAIQRYLGTLSLDELRLWCESLDPARSHLGRAQLLRAIEIALLTGERLSDMQARRTRPSRWRASYLLIDPGPALSARIVSRATAMLDGEWPGEVQRLMRSVPADAPAWKATGYEVVRDFVSGIRDRDATLEQIVIETRQYAKRQRTWFRNQLDAALVQHIMPGAPGEEAIVDRWMDQVDSLGSASESPS